PAEGAPGGPPPRRASHLPSSCIRVPSLTPAGILTVYRFVRRSRPVPPQFAHGFSITVPLPRHRGHGCDSAKKPWLSETTPRPRHSGQTTGAVPGCAPEPPHSRHAVSSWTGIFVSRPFRESSNERLTSTSTSFPRWVWARCGPAPRPRLKIPPRKSPRSPKSMLSLLNPPPPKLKFPGPGRPAADP